MNSDKNTIDTLYDVVISGDLYPDKELEDVLKEISITFGIDNNEIKDFFSYGKRVVTRNINATQGNRYLLAFDRIGVYANLEKSSELIYCNEIEFDENNFNVVITGEIYPDRDLESVIEIISKRFQISKDYLQDLFGAGKKIVSKKNKKTTACKIAKALNDIGIYAEIEEESILIENRDHLENNQDRIEEKISQSLSQNIKINPELNTNESITQQIPEGNSTIQNVHEELSNKNIIVFSKEKSKSDEINNNHSFLNQKIDSKTIILSFVMTGFFSYILLIESTKDSSTKNGLSSMGWWKWAAIILILFWLAGIIQARYKKIKRNSGKESNAQRDSNILSEAQEIADKIHTVKQYQVLLKMKEDYDLQSIEATTDKSCKNASRKAEILQAALEIASKKVFEYQFIPPLNLKTPLKYLEHAYKLFTKEERNRLMKELSCNLECWSRIDVWHEPEEPGYSIFTLRKFRKIVEQEGSQKTLISKINKLVESDPDNLAIFFSRSENLSYGEEWFAIQLQNDGLPFAFKLYAEGYTTPEKCLSISPEEFSKKRGVGPKTKHQLIEYQNMIKARLSK